MRYIASLFEVFAIGSLKRMYERGDPLKGALKEFWSILISGNWRVIFRFDDGDAYDVDLSDYH